MQKIARPAVRVFLLFIFGTFFSTFAVHAERPTHAELYPDFVEMQSELPVFTFGSDPPMPTVRKYYAPCSAGTDATYNAGTFRSLGTDMAVHVWSPPEERVRGSVVVLHGYLAHPVQLSALIQALIKEGYVVAAPELPGHGLSGGPRAYISDFSDYGTFFGDFWARVGHRLPGPVHAVGFSTGASTLLEYLATESDPFGALIFASPLVRSYRFFWSRVGRVLTRPFVRTVRTGYDDPLGTQRMPLAWFDAQVRWDRRNGDYGPFSRPLLMIQGDKDTVVSRRYNRDYLEERFAPFTYVEIPGGEHVVFRGPPEIREVAIDATLAAIHQAEKN